MAVSSSPASGSSSPTQRAEGEPGAPAPEQASAVKSQKYAPPILAFGVVAMCLIVVGAVGIMVVYPQLRAAYHWRKAQEAIDHFDLPAAQDHLSKCLEVWTTSGETEFLLARTCRRAGDVEAARQHLKKAKNLHWVDSQIHLEYLLIQAQAVLLPAVEDKLKAMLEEGHRDDQLILEALVVGCLQGNFFQKAYQWATVWLEQHPNDWEANFYRAVIHEVGMRHDLAAKEYEKALELNPFFPEIHLHLARVYLLDNKSKNALPHFQEYLNHDPNDPAALLGLAQCLRSQAQPAEARAVSRQLLAVHPGDVGGCVLEAQLALEEDNYSEAQHWLRQALQVDPFDRLSNQNMAMALRHEAAALKADNRPQEAEEKQRQAKEFEEKNQQITQTNLRVEDINRELREKPDNVALRTEAGTLLMKVGQYREASRWLVSAWLLNPQHQPAKDAINECLHKLGDRKLLERYQAILESRREGEVVR